MLKPQNWLVFSHRSTFFLTTKNIHFWPLIETGAVSIYDNSDQLGQLKDALGSLFTRPETRVWPFILSAQRGACDRWGQRVVSSNSRRDFFKNRFHHDKYVNYGTLNQRPLTMTNTFAQLGRNTTTHSHTQTHNYPQRAVPLAVILSSILWAEPLMANLQAFGGKRSSHWWMEGLRTRQYSPSSVNTHNTNTHTKKAPTHKHVRVQTEFKHLLQPIRCMHWCTHSHFHSIPAI